MEEINQLKINVFEQPPSAAVFASEIESKNVPAVFTGCVKNWRAYTTWNPANGEELVFWTKFCGPMVSIMNSEDKNKVQLEALRNDIQVFQFLDTKELMSINLWMNNGEARSSTHYDPHHNVLCVVAGRKKVTL